MSDLVNGINGLSVETTGQLVTMSKGQKLLLSTIRNCVANRQPLTWDLIVLVYTESVRKVYVDDWRFKYGYEKSVKEYNILEEYQKQSGQWTYTIRSLVRSWLLSNIGILVLKNQLIVIPTMEIE